MRQLADAVAKLPFKIEFTAFFRTDLLRAHREQIELAEQIGVKSLFFGIETFNKEAGSLVGKGLTGDTSKAWLLELKDRWDPKGITFQQSYIVGLPGDTIQNQYDTHRWNVDNKMHSWQFSALMVLSPKIHGGKQWLSEFEKNVDKYGFKFPSQDPFYWENHYTNWLECTQVTNDLRKDSYRLSKPAAWSWIGLANLGYTTLEQQNQFSLHDLFSSTELKKKKQQRAKDYISLLCNFNNITLP